MPPCLLAWSATARPSPAPKRPPPPRCAGSEVSAKIASPRALPPECSRQAGRYTQRHRVPPRTALARRALGGAPPHRAEQLRLSHGGSCHKGLAAGRVFEKQLSQRYNSLDRHFLPSVKV